MLNKNMLATKVMKKIIIIIKNRTHEALAYAQSLPVSILVHIDTKKCCY